jgi:hypothetical protein
VVNRENVPWVPRRSGTHIAESCTPRSFSAGKVIGTRRMQLKTPCSLRIFQNGWLLRSRRTSGLPRGMRYFPSRRTRRGGRISTELSFGW